MFEHFCKVINQQAANYQKIIPIMEGLFIAPNPAPVKTALQIKGMNVGSVRLPLSTIK